MKLKRVVIFATVCLFGLGFLASPAFAFKIGAVFSATGRTSFLGDPEKKTAEMLVEKAMSWLHATVGEEKTEECLELAEEIVV